MEKLNISHNEEVKKEKISVEAPTALQKSAEIKTR